MHDLLCFASKVGLERPSRQNSQAFPRLGFLLGLHPNEADFTRRIRKLFCNAKVRHRKRQSINHFEACDDLVCWLHPQGTTDVERNDASRHSSVHGIARWRAMYYAIEVIRWFIPLGRDMRMRLTYRRDYLPDRKVVRDFLVSAETVAEAS